MEEKVFKWLDAHKLTGEEVEDYDYLENIISNYEEEFGELEEDEVINLIRDYQIYFLKSRFQQIVEIETSKRDVIQDRTIYEDAHIFAANLHEMGLMTTRDHENYQAIFDNITSFIKPPDLLIYLKASVPTLVNNIQRRGREYEASIRIDYLSKLNEKYEDWIKNYNLGRLLILDKDKLDFSNNPEDLGKVIQAIETEINGLF
jgi:deoxyadenosine/deoxycytidine kinase